MSGEGESVMAVRDIFLYPENEAVLRRRSRQVRSGT
jgi:hypothetical protein